MTKPSVLTGGNTTTTGDVADVVSRQKTGALPVVKLGRKKEIPTWVYWVITTVLFIMGLSLTSPEKLPETHITHITQ